MADEDAEDEAQEAALEARLGRMLPLLEEELRRSGLYVDRTESHHLPDGTLIVGVDCLIGDLAWSDRVQDPQVESVDDELRVFQADLEAENYERRKKVLAERLAAGKSVFDDEDDE